MQAEGKKKVEFFISKAYNNLLPCFMTQDKYTTKRIGWDHWLCEVVCDLQVPEEGKDNEQECLHETLLFRRRKNMKADQNGWELVYIHNSFTYRTLIITIFAGLSGIIYILEKNRRSKNERKK